MSNLKNCSNIGKACVRSENVMSKILKSMYVGLISTTIIFQACSGGNYEKNKSEESAQVAENSVANTVKEYVRDINTDTINGVTHNFVRNAKLKCKVKDVLNSTKQIEDIVSNNGGYVTLSDLTSSSNYNNSIQFKKDSVLELNYFTTVSNISIRVPNKQLDTVILKITDMAVFVDFRILKADDVKMKLFANKLAETRLTQYNKSLQQSVTKINDKLNSVTNAHENILEKQTRADEKRIESIDLADQVNYSTLNLQLYQAQSVSSQIKTLPPVYKTYEPSFSNKLNNACLNGWQIIKAFLLFLVDIWGLLLILTLLFFGIRWIVIYFTKNIVKI